MKRQMLTLGAGLVLLSGFVLLAEGGEDKGAKEVQGAWTAAEGQKKMALEFKGNKFTLKDLSKEEEHATGTYTVDASKKPRTMDLTVTGGTSGEAAKYKGKTSKAIYEVEGDTLKWCANEPGKEGRPKEFAAQEGEMRYLFITFKRAK